MAWVYQSFQPGLWTVGFYDPAGKFQPESDHASTALAAARVAYLNGGLFGSASQAEPEQLSDRRANGRRNKTGGKKK